MLKDGFIGILSHDLHTAELRRRMRWAEGRQDKKLIATKIGQDMSWVRFLATMAIEIIKEFILFLKGEESGTSEQLRKVTERSSLLEKV